MWMGVSVKYETLSRINVLNNFPGKLWSLEKYVILWITEDWWIYHVVIFNTCILYWHCMCKFVYFWLLFFLFISMHVGFVSSFTGTHVYTIAIGLRVYLPKIMTCCSKNILLDRYCEFIQNNGAVTETWEFSIFV